MPTLRQKCAAMLAGSIAGILCGVFAGYFLAWEITVWATGARLDQYASQLIADSEASASELRTALTALDVSPSGACSAGEISYFRALLFESDYLKDAGRMREDGRIECSAALGRRSRASAPSRPDFILKDGTSIYKDLPQYQNSDLPAMTLQRGNSFVAFIPMIRMHLQPAPLRYTVTTTNETAQEAGTLMGDPLPPGAPKPTEEGKQRIGESMYATRCSIRFFTCATAFTTLPEIVHTNEARFYGCIGLCGLFGGLAGLAISLLYRRNKSMEQQLRRAIRRNELKVVYQPLVDLATEQIIGAEALSRWTDEEGHVVNPEFFIHIAEERGFIRDITRFVVRRVLKDFAQAMRSNPDFRVSINVTASDLADPGFLKMLDDSLAQAKVAAQSLTIEITESCTVRHQVAKETIRGLRQRGHSVHIDDFGTGYSSLAYLHDLSVDAIKIDKAFTQAIGTGSVTVAILPQILAMAEALQLGVIAEGIETTQQASYFAGSAQAVLGQGWLFGRPIPAANFLQLLAGAGKQSLVSAIDRRALAPVGSASELLDSGSSELDA
jgi:sensor c-di-GMP phosphodiesterase-like protein